ncbi:MAG: NAD-dependent epimerase/dehydratase family protein [Candidatus Cloacimonetes bacterium]|nr:NAD-dependent epimerase/dehydratase family protein [Candidatus Cloacimonadota bacterium]
MKIAITGANGFVGNTLLNHFSAAGYEAIALLRPHAKIPSGTYQVRHLDYQNPATLAQAVSDIDILIHNAGKSKALNHLEIYEANVGLTRRVVQALNRQKRQIQLIYISSQAAARESVGGELVSEDMPSQPLTTYGKSKYRAEKLIRESCRQPFSIVRPCPIYGAQDRDFLQLFQICKYGLSFQIGRKERGLNMIHVGQLAEFIALLVNNPKAFGETFFATDGQIYSQSYISECICRAMGKKELRIVVPEVLAKMVFNLGEIFGQLSQKPSQINKEKQAEIMADAWLADPTKAKALLGWEPQPRLPELIEETYRWYLEAGWL